MSSVDPTSPSDEVCGARTRAGGPCRLPAGSGTDHHGVGRCRFHGGSTPNARRGAAVVILERDARAELERLGAPEPIRHPVVELLDLAAEVNAWKQILRRRVAVLEDLQTVDKLGAERERAVVVLYERALDRCERVLTSLAKLDLDSKRFRLERDMAEVLYGAVDVALRVLPVEQAILVREALAAEVRRLGPPDATERPL